MAWYAFQPVRFFAALRMTNWGPATHLKQPLSALPAFVTVGRGPFQRPAARHTVKSGREPVKPVLQGRRVV